jgi:hypothetical protein
MGYTLLQISGILLKADRTMYKVGLVAYDDMFNSLDEALEYNRDIIYIYKKAVEYGDDLYLGQVTLDTLVEKLGAKVAIYDYGQLNPIYSDATILNYVIPMGSVLNDLDDVTITNLQDNQILKYNAALKQWVNTGSNAAIRSTQAFTAALNQTVFVTTSQFTAPLLDVYLNGVRLNSSSYTTFGNHTITLVDGCLADDIIDVTIYDPQTDILDMIGYVKNTRTLTINGTTYDLSADRTWNVPTIYSGDGTIAGNRIVTLDDKQLVFRSNQSTLQNYTFNTGTPTGVPISTWPSSVIFEGEYLMNTANAEPYNTRVWGRNQSSSIRTFWVNQVIADITSESTGAANIYNQWYSSRRGSQLDTGPANVIGGVTSQAGHGYLTTQNSTTENITTGVVQVYQSLLLNYGGNITNAYSYIARVQLSNSLASNNTRNSTITNLYNLYIENNIGGNFATATVTNLYAIYIASIVGVTGTITNRWGIYAPDVLMNHYINGILLLGTTTPSTYKLDVVGTARVSGDMLINSITAGIGNSVANFSNLAFGTNANSLLDATASSNTSVGYGAGQSNVSSSANTFFGWSAGNLTTGANNTFIGSGAGRVVTTGIGNIIIGRFTGVGSQTSNYNTIVGHISGSLTASNNIILSDGQGNIRIRAFDTGNVVIGGSSDSSLAKLQVTGSIQQSSVLSSLLKTDGSGVLVAATLGTDYSVLPSQTGNTGKYLTTDGSVLSWSNVVVDNIYTANGTLTGDRIVNSGGFSLTFNPNIYINGALKGMLSKTVSTPTGTYSQSSGLFYNELFTQDDAPNVNYTGAFINAAVNKGGTFLSQFALTGLEADVTMSGTGSNSRLYGRGLYGYVKRGFSTDISTNSNNFLIGITTQVLQAHETSVSIYTGTSQVTNLVAQYDSGIVNNSYSIYTLTSVGSNSVSKAVQVNNHYGFYSLLRVGGPSANAATVSNYYGIYLDAPIVSGVGSITNRWGIYAPDVLMTHYINGSLLLGTATNVPSSQLTIDSTTKGFLPPRMTTAQRDAIASPATGLVIYNTTTLAANVYNGTSWVGLGGGDNIYTADGALTGDRTVTSGTFKLYFDGGIYIKNSAQSQLISVYYATGTDGNNIWIGGGGLLSSSASGSTGYGSNNTSHGVNALLSNTIGFYNVGIGINSLSGNTTGGNNTAVGGASLIANTTGNNNSAFGRNALPLNTSGGNNTSIGLDSLKNNTTGSLNVAIGRSAGGVPSGVNANTTGSNNIFIGYNSTGVSSTESDRTWIGNSSTTSTWLGGNLLLGTTSNDTYRLDVVGTARISSDLTALSFIKSGGTSAQFLKADGSVDTNSYVTGNIYTANGTLTGDRVVDAGGFSLTLNPNLILGGKVTGYALRTYPLNFTTSGTSYSSAIQLDNTITANGGSQIFYAGQINSGTLTNDGTLGVLSSPLVGSITSLSVRGLTSGARVSSSGSIININRGDSTDVSTSTSNFLLGYNSQIFHAANLPTTSLTNTANNYIGGFTIASGIVTTAISADFTLSMTASPAHSNSSVTNYYGVRLQAIIGATSGPTATLANYYGIYIDTPAVRLTGSIGSRWGVYAPDSLMNHYINGNVSIGNATILASAILSVTSTTKGFLPPRMTSTERAAIGSPATGLIVYQTDGTEGLYQYKGTGGWTVVGGGGGGTWGTITGTLSSQTDLQSALDARVPYTGATGDVDLGTHRILAQNATITSSGSGDTFTLNHSSGSGIGINITKGGSGEGLYVNKTSGSGNAATIIGTLNATTLVKSGGTSSQFLKADGSVDSTSYTPTSRTLTINGVSQDLSANRTYTIDALPSQTGNSGKYLTTDGTNASWSNLAYSVTSVSTTYSESATSGTKIIKATTAGGAFTINLPTAVGNTATIIIKKTAGSANLTIDGAGTETIDGGLTAILRRVDESITLVSDNSNWLII